LQKSISIFALFNQTQKTIKKKAFLGKIALCTERLSAIFGVFRSNGGGYGSYATMSITDDEIYYLKIAFVGSQRLPAV
jgi:hypothetical protein